MITIKDLKQIKSLSQKKFRKEYQQFVVEGAKSVQEFIAHGFDPIAVYATTPLDFAPYILIKAAELKRMTALKNPSHSF